MSAKELNSLRVAVADLGGGGGAGRAAAQRGRCLRLDIFKK